MTLICPEALRRESYARAMRWYSPCGKVLIDILPALKGGEDVNGEASQRAEEASLDPVTSVIEHGEPSKVIRDYIAENGIDLAVLGTHGRTDFSRYVMGGVSAKLV